MMTPILRARYARQLSLFALTLCVAGGAAAQGTFPGKPVNIVTPFAVGSGPDAVLRQVADRLSKMWKQPVIVNNKTGGGGFVAFAAAQGAPADGYTLLQLDSEHLAAVPYLYKSRRFATLEVFEPVASLFRTPFLVTVSANSPWKTVKDLVDAGKSAPGKIMYGS